MARSDNNLKSVLQDTANAIRAKTGASEPIIPRDFADEIENMPTGGGDEVALIERTISGEYSNAQISAVGSYAFAHCSDLTDVNLPNCTKIDSYAFYFCRGLSEISFPNCVEIGSYAFNYCLSLKRAVFSQCSRLGSFAFGNCENIEEMRFDSLEVIPAFMASKCSSVLSIISFPNAIGILSSAFLSCNLISEFVFPKCIYIGPGAFVSTSMDDKHFSFPEAMFIENQAFSYCRINDYLSFPKCLFIGPYAFSDNRSVKGFNFPECRIIERNFAYSLGWAVSNHIDQFSFPKLRFAFETVPFFYQEQGYFTGSMLEFPNCYIATGVSGPRSLFLSFPKALELNDFTLNGREGGGTYCPNVFWINYFHNIENYSSEVFEMKKLCFISGGWMPFDSSTAKMKVIDFPILFSVSCGNFIMQCPDLETLNVPNLKSYSSAFSYNTKLSSLALHNMSRINNNMMTSCSSLESFYLFNASTVAVPLNNVNAFQSTPMSNSTYLGRFGSIYVHPDRVTLYQGATNWATYASRITAAPSEMLNSGIWNWEFVNRSDLTEIPSEKLNAKNVGDGAFSGCYNLSSVNLPECLFIGMSAFVNCSLLSQVNAPKTQFIDSCAFMSNSRIESIDFTSCLFVGASAFYNCQKLSFANLDSCVRISERAFYGCHSLISVNLGNCLSISRSAFAYCSSLSVLKAPLCVNIEVSAFAFCTHLREAFLPYCFSISSCAFWGCSSLERIVIPFIGRMSSYVFVNCSKLESVYIFNTGSVYMENNVFSQTPIDNSTYLGHYGSIYVRASMVEIMKRTIQYNLSDRIVGLTDEEIASVYQSFGYDVSDF